MAELIACLGSGAASLEYIRGLIAGEQWERCIVISAEQSSLPADIIAIDPKQPLPEMAKEIKAKIYKVLGEPDFGREVALNLASGSGKEHMALLSAIMQLGFGFRLVALTNEGVKEI